MPGTLFVVATPIGNLEDVTARALRVLREVALIAAEDTRRTSHLLARYAIPTPTTSLHKHNEHAKSSAIIAQLMRGESIALVSDAGTPTISDPGSLLIRKAIDAGIRVEPIPGPSAALSALAVSGMPTDTFTFLGFPPTQAKARKSWFDELVTSRRTVVFFEAPHRIKSTLEELQSKAGDLNVCVARELTKQHEQLVRGPISSVLSNLGEPIGEYTIVVNVGLSTENGRPAAISDADIAAEFGDLTESTGFSRADAMAEIGRRHGLSRNLVYKALERAKTSGA